MEISKSEPHTYVTTIYKIECKNKQQCPGVFVGDGLLFADAVRRHKFISELISPYNYEYNARLYKAIREYGGWGNWDIIELEKFTYHFYRERQVRVNYWENKEGSSLNSSNRELRDLSRKLARKRYQQENKEKIYKRRRESKQEKLKMYEELRVQRFYEFTKRRADREKNQGKNEMVGDKV